jgi:cbb3-type cytochrome oxidase subunit 3
MTLSNTKETIDISDQWSYEKIFEFHLLLTVKKIDNNSSFFSKSNISFFSLSGSKINFDNLLIKDNSESIFYFSLLIFFILTFILVIYFIQKRRPKADGYKRKKDIEEQKYLFIRADRANHRVLLNEITLIEGKKDYVKVTVNDKSYYVRKNLKTFLKDLPTSKFVRISKSLALNIEQIKKIDKNMLFVKSGEYFIIGKKYSQEIKELLK